MPKLLFLTKYREHSYTATSNLLDPCSKPFSSGLYNSVKFITDMLIAQGYDAVHESCIDNNCIDRLVTLHRPTHVIFEALWVVPTKLDVLKVIHPSVTWVLRLHSEVPFLANEGIAIEWMREYTKRGAVVTANSPRMCIAAEIVCHAEVPYTPNYYPVSSGQPYTYTHNNVLNVGCFGAIRPLKNHLMQAKAAMKYAEDNDQTLFFHINGTRLEGNGEPVLKNIRALFHDSGHELIEHDWLDHTGFLRLLGQMDIVMQCSMTETFNIVVADAINENIPVVTSDEIKFVSGAFVADPNDINDIIRKIDRAIRWGKWKIHIINKMKLRKNAKRAIAEWRYWISTL